MPGAPEMIPDRLHDVGHPGNLTALSARDRLLAAADELLRRRGAVCRC